MRELKSSVPLQPWQNPCEKEFWDAPAGYGNEIEEAFPSAQKHYAVMGASVKLIDLLPKGSPTPVDNHRPKAERRLASRHPIR